jgi:putative ABC transport system permease protein
MPGLRPRWNKVLSDLWSNKFRSLLVITSIAVGVFAIGMIISVHGILNTDMRSSYEKINPAHITLFAPDFDFDFTDTIRRMPEIEDAEAARFFTLRLHVLPDKNEGKDNWITIKLMAVRDFNKVKINQVGLLDGQWPPKDKEIVFDQHKFSDAHTALGEEVELKLPDNKIKQMPVVGLVQDESLGATEGGGYFTADLQGYVTFDTLKWLQQDEKANVLYARVSSNINNREHILDVARLVSKKFEDNNNPIYYFGIRANNDHPNASYIDAMTSTLYIFGFLVVFLSGFLITNTLSALLNQQMEQIGIIKTLGGRSSQIITIYMVLILVYSLIALGIALPFSGQVGYWMLNFLAKEVNFQLQGYREIPLAIVMQIIIALLVPQVSGFVPIMRGSMITVQEAINGPDQSRNNDKKFWGGHFINNLQGLPRPLILSLRNTFRRKSRLALTLITLTLGGATFIATFNVQASMQSFISTLSQYFAADITLDFEQPHHIEKIARMLQENPDIHEVEGWAVARGEIMLVGDKPGESVNILAPPANSKLVEPVLLAGRWIVPGDENAIAINDTFKDRFPDLKIGDILRLRVYDKKIDWVVVGIFQFAGKTSGYIGYANYDYLSQITHTGLKASSYRIVSSQSKLSIEQQREQGRELEVFFNKLGYKISDVSAGQSMLESATSGLNVLILFLLVMATLAAIIGSIGLTGTLSMNVLDRTREIAVMRAIGASDKEVMRLVIIEGLLIGTMSWVLGSLLAFPISEALWNVISKSLFDSVSNFTFNITGFILWMFVELILSVIASILPARSAARLTIREALAYE